jgi:redox-sensitive bicupin YhaK (pirin superfamily)
MSAGTGVRHSEFNPSSDRPVHFLQIWIQPSAGGIPPSYEQKRFEPTEKRGRLRLIASPDAREGSVTIHQDADVYAGLFHAKESALHTLAPGRKAYVHVARGRISINGAELGAGDAAKITGEPAVRLEAGDNAEVLLFDLA